MGNNPPRQVLQRRLARVEGLAERAETDGERRAALAAAERLRARLAASHTTIPADPLLAPAGRIWPDRSKLRGLVEDWTRGRMRSEALSEWAQGEVGKCLLPDVPVTDPVSVEVEVLLQLSTLHLDVLHPARDGPALQAFLDTPEEDTEGGWRTWFRHLRGEAAPALPGAR